MSFVADRGTGNCAIVSAWESKEALDGSEQAIASIRSETVDLVAGQLNRIELAEVLREVRVSPSQVGCRSRVVVSRLRPAAPTLADFYERWPFPASSPTRIPQRSVDP